MVLLGKTDEKSAVVVVVEEEEAEADDGTVVFDELKTLEERLRKARLEFENSQKVLDAYKLLQGDDTVSQRELEEKQKEEQKAEQKVEDKTEEVEEELVEEVDEKQEEDEEAEAEATEDLLFVEMYNEHVSSGAFDNMREVEKFIALYENASSNKLIILASI